MWAADRFLAGFRNLLSIGLSVHASIEAGRPPLLLLPAWFVSRFSWMTSEGQRHPFLLNDDRAFATNVDFDAVYTYLVSINRCDRCVVKIVSRWSLYGFNFSVHNQLSNGSLLSLGIGRRWFVEIEMVARNGMSFLNFFSKRCLYSGRYSCIWRSDLILSSQPWLNIRIIWCF